MSLIPFPPFAEDTAWQANDERRKTPNVTRDLPIARSHPRSQPREDKVVSREEWTAARKELLKAEKQLTRRSDELAKWRQELPGVKIDQMSQASGQRN